MKTNNNYRIQLSDQRFKFAGTGQDSWFTLESARQKVDYKKGERIVECHTLHGVLWEVL